MIQCNDDRKELNKPYKNGKQGESYFFDAIRSPGRKWVDFRPHFGSFAFLFLLIECNIFKFDGAENRFLLFILSLNIFANISLCTDLSFLKFQAGSVETIVVIDGNFEYFWEKSIFSQLFWLAEVLFQIIIIVNDVSNIASGTYFAFGSEKLRIKLSAIFGSFSKSFLTGITLITSYLLFIVIFFLDGLK